MTSSPLESGLFRAPSAVWIIDDEFDHVAIIQWILAEIAPSLPVQSLSTTAELHEQLDTVPDGALLLFDRMINGRESLDLLPALRASRPDLTFTLMSSVLSETDRARALAAGADFAVEKPGRVADWRVLLAEMLRPLPDSWSAVA